MMDTFFRAIPLLLFIFTTHLSMAQDAPNMKAWTKIWHNADAKRLQAIYTNDATVFPGSKPSIQGNQQILTFMCGGLGKVNVLFEPTKKIVQQEMAFEVGQFQDVELHTDKITAQGTYAVTWIKEQGKWKIKCHVWTVE